MSNDCPRVTPGDGTAEIVAELSCWKRLSDSGTTVVFKCTIVETGIDTPLAVLI
jgi:hypothetical protein